LDVARLPVGALGREFGLSGVKTEAVDEVPYWDFLAFFVLDEAQFDRCRFVLSAFVCFEHCSGEALSVAANFLEPGAMSLSEFQEPRSSLFVFDQHDVPFGG
jgi:hypothetical protein